jgi:rubrerythrin
MELSEVLLTALKLETDGRAFYLRASGMSQSSETKAMFERLASDEKNHFTFIQRQYDELRAGRGWSAIPEMEKVTALDFGFPVFPKGRAVPAVLPQDPTEEDALLFALAAEMKSCNLYSDAFRRTTDPEARQMFLQLAKAESGHFDILMLCYEGRYGYPR